jgi:hypothetical protein
MLIGATDGHSSDEDAPPQQQQSGGRSGDISDNRRSGSSTLSSNRRTNTGSGNNNNNNGGNDGNNDLQGNLFVFLFPPQMFDKGYHYVINVGGEQVTNVNRIVNVDVWNVNVNINIYNYMVVVVVVVIISHLLLLMIVNYHNHLCMLVDHYLERYHLCYWSKVGIPLAYYSFGFLSTRSVMM